jgi:TldD protein
MTQALEAATRSLLHPAGLDQRALERLLARMLGRPLDAAELYFQRVRAESWSLEDGIVKDGSFSVDGGVGVRAVAGEKSGFAYSDEILLPALEQAADAARGIVRGGGETARPVAAWQARHAPARYGDASPFASLADTAKVELLKRLDALARGIDPRVREVSVSLVGRHETMLVVASDGTLGGDVRPLVRLNVSVIAEAGGRRERGSAGAGGRFDYDWFVTDGRAEALVRDAVRSALVNLDARPAPAGGMPVVLGAGWPGVLLHEAVGHGLEGDFNRKGTSVYAGRIGERVASPLCTVVDDGTLPGRRGSLTIDDEGTPGARNVLIEDGVLRGYLQDRMNARLMHVAPTGNGRRQSYAHQPMPRMTNTFLLAGPHGREEIIRNVRRGLYAVEFGGGSVDITSGKFVFSATEAYLIEDGRVTAPVRGATLIGNGPDVMQRISMVGNDLALDGGVGVCGKDGQSVPVGVGQPTLLVDELTVGGTA